MAVESAADVPSPATRSPGPVTLPVPRQPSSAARSAPDRRVQLRWPSGPGGRVGGSDRGSGRAAWSRPALAVAVICVCSFTASLVLQATLFRDGSGDADEAAYVLQARMLLDGHLTLDAATMEPFFRPWLTGEHDGRLFTKYLPGWPALLAASQALFGTMTVAPALVAAGWVAGTYRLARELLDDAASAVLAAALVAGSPLVVVHTALPLAYACGAATLTLASAALLRGARTGARSSLLAGGAGAGFALLLRPFDAVLVLTGVVVFALARLRRQPRAIPARVGWAVLGAAPFVAVLLVFCRLVTGSALRMPLSASDPLDRFGFGPRRILPSEPTFTFTRHLALRALEQTCTAAPGWLFGGVVVVGFAAVGAVLARRRAQRLLLVVTVVAVAGGYLFWWGSAFAMPGLRDGLGPHYHLAALTPILILAADGARRLWSAAAALPRAAVLRPTAAGVVVVTMVLLTASAVPGKVDGQRWVNDHNAFLAALLPDRFPAPAVVVVTPQVPSRYTQVPYQTLRNRPDLHGRVLYAADLGPATATLPEDVPGRALYRLRPDEIADPAAPASFYGSFTALRQVSGERIRVHLTARLPAGSAAGAAAYVRLGAQTRIFPVTPSAGDRVDPSIADPSIAGPAVIDATLVVTSGEPAGAGELGAGTATLPGELVVGVVQPTAAGPARWEERIPLARRHGSGALTLLTPGLGWRQVPGRAAVGWLPAPVRPTLAVAVGLD
ncbi:glycosyltransferase family 39 protein [Frankia sp. AvcI1]|uniref:DUF7846 domain-containing protein n=1 Tax=Frankia sp. AvcI1 TaxID=573496 RepID=UPI000A48BD84|nr:glycosyltransferase family 39 protein [Frankia sp. AvcI1]